MGSFRRGTWNTKFVGSGRRETGGQRRKFRQKYLLRGPLMRGLFVVATVAIGGLPVEGAELVLSDGHETATTSTDSAGHFNIGPLRTYEATTWLIGDPLYGYSLDIRVADSQYQGLTAFRSGYAPAELEVTCDISKPSAVCTPR
jgi:hypothetical protein